MSEEKKFAPLVHEMKVEHTNWGSWCYSPQLYFRGEEEIPGAQYNAGWQLIMEPICWEREAHFHREEEYLVFMNGDLYHPEEFDAEITIWLGEDVDHMEFFTITKPTIVRIPAGYWHCPMEFVKVGKPVMFQAVYLAGTCGRVVRRKKEDGKYEFIYGGPETMGTCRLVPGKKCTYCGKCFRLALEKEKAEKAENT